MVDALGTQCCTHCSGAAHTQLQLLHPRLMVWVVCISCPFRSHSGLLEKLSNVSLNCLTVISALQEALNSVTPREKKLHLQQKQQFSATTGCAVPPARQVGDSRGIPSQNHP